MHKSISFFIMILLTFSLISKNSISIEPEEILKNKQHELRARNIFKNITWIKIFYHYVSLTDFLQILNGIFCCPS